MARCGIWLRHPVKIVVVGDDGAGLGGPVVGDAETLREAVALVEKNGFRARGADDGGRHRLAADGEDAALCFIITVYPLD
jgi:hypothetical protein